MMQPPDREPSKEEAETVEEVSEEAVELPGMKISNLRIVNLAKKKRRL